MHPNLVSLRKAGPGDELFLFTLYASTRAAEMALFNWTPLQKDTFLQMQYHAQRRSYAAQFPSAQHQIIFVAGQPAGRIISLQTPEEILLIDIALLPEYRGQGTGTSLIRSLQSQAAQAGLPVRLHVEMSNPAQFLYERLGFRKTGHNGIYFSMEWQPDPAHRQNFLQVLDSQEF